MRKVKRNENLHNLIMQVRYKLKDYDRCKQEYENIIHSSHKPFDGLPRGTNISNPTEDKGLKLAKIGDELYAIDQAIILTKGEYSSKTDENFDPIKAYWSYDYFNYMHIRKSEDDNGPVYRTWIRYKESFSILIAGKLNLI